MQLVGRIISRHQSYVRTPMKMEVPQPNDEKDRLIFAQGQSAGLRVLLCAKGADRFFIGVSR